MKKVWKQAAVTIMTTLTVLGSGVMVYGEETSTTDLLLQQETPDVEETVSVPVEPIKPVINQAPSHRINETVLDRNGLTYKITEFSGLNLTKRMGKGDQITNIAITLNNMGGNIAYDAYVNNGGWQPWTFNDQPTGGMEDSTYLEGIRIMPREDLERYYDVYYSVTMSGLGKLGYAKNGQMAGAPGRGEHVTDIDIVLVEKGGMAPGSVADYYWAPFYDFFYYENGQLLYEDSLYTGWLESGDYRYYILNGQIATGWQYIDGYKYYFETDGTLVQNVDHIIGVQNNYLVKINKQTNCLTVYASDGANGYVIPVKSMLTSVGDDTPVGSFKTPEKYRWRLMVTDTYTQYATRIKKNTKFLIHSVIYDVQDNHTLWTGTYNALGVARSRGCVRLTTGDSKWIYDRCKIGTTIVVYNDPVPGPFQKPDIIPVPETQTWDPTDPDA